MARTKYKQPQVKIVKAVVYQIELFGKFYIGITTQSLKARIQAHIREARSNKPYKPDSLPYVEPYENYKGKNSAIKRIFNTDRVNSVIRYLDTRKQNKYVFNLVMSKTTVIRNVRCKAVFNNEIQKWEVDRTRLEQLESKLIRDRWIENPKQLLNCRQVPFNLGYSHKLEDALTEDIKKLRKKYKVTDDSDMEITIKAIKKNRRSNYREQLAIIRKEVKLLVDGSSDYRRKALEEADRIELENLDF